MLPSGFHPLAKQSDLTNEADHYNGWPRYIVCKRDGMIMAYVPTQTVLMGGGTDKDERPARNIVVNHFYMDIHEVTNRQFSKYGGGSFKAFWKSGFNDDHPARNVSWFAASGYAKWAGKSLPTEAQWETAARGDDARIYPWGNEEQSEVTHYLCNALTGRGDFDGYEFAAPAMNFAAGVSPHGMFNMAGNVWEWCADNYDPGRYAYPNDEDPPTGLQRGPKPFGDANYPNPEAKDVREARVGPQLGDERVVRGGSFADPIDRCRVDARMGIRPGATLPNVGFRTVLRLPPVQ
jgi:formylglycine-generating enzyme required for sulfatase activity